MPYQLLCSADFHQGDDRFHDLSKGRQCVANCMMFLVMSKLKGNNEWSKNDLHVVLCAGDYMYLKLQQEKNFLHAYLLPSELPEFLLFRGLVFGFTILKTYSGTLDKHFIGEYPLLPLQSALQNMLQTCRKMQGFAILIVNGNAVGIYFNVQSFTIFDPHARNDMGMICSENGTCVIGVVRSLSELCLFVRSLFNTTSQYDLHNIKLSLSQKKSRTHVTVDKLTIIPSDIQLYESYLTLETDNDNSLEDSCFSKQINILETRKRHSVGCHKFPNYVKKPKFPATKTSPENQVETINDSHGSMGNDCSVSAYGGIFCGTTTHNNSASEKRSSKTMQLIDLPFLDEVQVLRTQNHQKRKNGKNLSKNIDFEKSMKHDRYVTDREIVEVMNVKNIDRIVNQFKARVLQGPEYVCSSCSQTYFKHRVMAVNMLKLETSVCNFMNKCLTGTKSVSNIEWVCLTCLKYIKIKKIPQCSHANDLKFPDKPPELELTPLEERLVAPRLPFMQIREMPRGGQLNIRGNVVNVPADVNNTVKMLPRFLNDTETIAVKFKRKLSYKHHVAFENIRPNMVLNAAKWLVENSILFRNEGIKVDETWLDNSQSMENELSDDNPMTDIVTGEKENRMSDSDNWTENDDFEDRPNGNLDTVLQPMDYREFNQILALAPGEGNTPLGLYQDTNAEFLSFPSIYCGQTRSDNNFRPVPIHYSTICKWELRNVDRRAALSIPAIFFKLKKLQIKQIKDKVGIAIRKCKTKGRKITANEILAPGVLDQITKQDDGYKVLRTLRGSPPYWEQAKKDLFAMIRQLGIPAWFCSFSAAETKWVPLLKSLWKLIKKKDPTEEEVANMSWQEKCHLIKSDPVTCARYFDYKVQSFISYVLQDESNPVGDIIDYFYRVEFQQRGSPHIHMLIWVKNAPVYEINDNKDVTNWLDRYVTCNKDKSMPTLINYQTHRHARTCRKKGKAICRFNFPLPPMPETMILEPLDSDKQSSDLKKTHESVIEFVNSNTNKDVSFQNFLDEVGLSLDQYLLCLRSVLKVPTVYLKRSLDEVRINSYNTILLKCWEANMDIQYILDPYACVSYIASYISKGQRGLSNLLYNACKESRLHSNNIQQQVRRVGNQFLTHVEVGAQEAVYLVLQIPLRRSTRDVVFIDTNPPDKRTALLKSISDIENLPKNSTNIEADNALKRYVRRPLSMHNCCYADFVSWFSVEFSKKREETIVVDNELPEVDYNYNLDDDISHNDENESVFTNDICEHANTNSGEFDVNCAPGTEFIFRCGTVMKKRRKQTILRYNRTCINVDSENHYRELIMLFTSWRNEECDLLQGCSSYEESFNKQKHVIIQKQSCYVKLGNNIDLDEVALRADDGTDDNIPDTVLSEIQHQEQIDLEQTPAISDMYGCFNPGDSSVHACPYDIGQDIGVSNAPLQCDTLPLNEFSDEDYRSMVQKLNEKQKMFFYHVLHLVKTNVNPLYLFLTGGAGVGKSVLLKSLYQALLKYLNKKVGENPDELKILLCAPTGKAAHNIGGNTLHSTFCIPISKGFNFKPLDMHQLNILRSRYMKLKVVFIDEISMVGRNMFDFINLRLQEITGCTKPFGGISIIAVGDLFQLKPVMDSWIFSQPSSTCDIRSISTNLWINLFTVYELDQIMRQKDDLNFAELLNRLREGNHTQDDIDKLKTRLHTRNDIDIEKVPHLFTTRAESELHNNSILSLVPNEKKTTVTAIDNISGNLSFDLQLKIISKIPNDAAKTMGLHKSLCVGEDLPAELCLNINIEDGMTNGTPCTIMKLDFRVRNSKRCSIIWVKFDEASVGSQWRQKYLHLYQNGIAADWTPILETTRRFCMQYFKTYYVVRRQFPIQMAAAKTVHKSQGSTLLGAVVHFGNRKNDHMHYVGLSRVQNLTSVHILELNEKKISVSKSVKGEMERLRSKAPVNICLPILSNYRKPESLIITFHNCRSLHKHIYDVRQDNLLLATDLLVFCETRLLLSDTESYHIDGFTLQRNDGTANSAIARSFHGMAAYSRIGVSNILMETINSIELVIFRILNIAVNICFIYCPPKCATMENLKIVFDRVTSVISLHEPTVVMGDFNQDLFKERSIAMYLENTYKFHQFIDKPTTDYGSCLDHIYANFTNLDNLALSETGTLESYFSDHKPVYIVFKLESALTVDTNLRF